MRNEVVELYLDDIIPNRFQPREIFEDEALKELSISIREHGVIQPIIVRKIGDKYEIIAGERRYKASALAGLTKIPAIIRDLDDKEASKVALLENLQRKDLTAIEEARTYQKILELDSMTQEELGQTMGKSQAAIANKLRLLSLTDEVQEALLNDQISERHARSLLNITNGNNQIEMLNRIIRERMTVRELDNEIKKMKSGTQVSLEFENKEVNEQQDIIQTSSLEQPKIETPIFNEVLEKTLELPKIEPDTILSNPIVEKPIEKENSFIPSFNMYDEFEENVIEPKLPSNVENISDNDFIEKFKYQDAVNLFKNLIPEIKNKGVNANIQEFDLDGKYQIVINIEK